MESPIFNGVFVGAIFLTGLTLGLVFSYLLHSRSAKQVNDKQLQSTRNEFLDYRATAQEALKDAQNSLDELSERCASLQDTLSAHSSKLATPPKSFEIESADPTLQLPLIKEDEPGKEALFEALDNVELTPSSAVRPSAKNNRVEPIV